MSQVIGACLALASVLCGFRLSPIYEQEPIYLLASGWSFVLAVWFLDLGFRQAPRNRRRRSGRPTPITGPSRMARAGFPSFEEMRAAEAQSRQKDVTE